MDKIPLSGNATALSLNIFTTHNNKRSETDGNKLNVVEIRNDREALLNNDYYTDENSNKRKLSSVKLTTAISDITQNSPTERELTFASLPINNLINNYGNNAHNDKSGNNIFINPIEVIKKMAREMPILSYFDFKRPHSTPFTEFEKIILDTKWSWYKAREHLTSVVLGELVRKYYYSSAYKSKIDTFAKETINCNSFLVKLEEANLSFFETTKLFVLLLDALKAYDVNPPVEILPSLMKFIQPLTEKISAYRIVLDNLKDEVKKNDYSNINKIKKNEYLSNDELLRNVPSDMFAHVRTYFENIEKLIIENLISKSNKLDSEFGISEKGREFINQKHAKIASLITNRYIKQDLLCLFDRESKEIDDVKSLALNYSDRILYFVLNAMNETYVPFLSKSLLFSLVDYFIKYPDEMIKKSLVIVQCLYQCMTDKLAAQRAAQTEKNPFGETNVINKSYNDLQKSTFDLKRTKTGSFLQGNSSCVNDSHLVRKTSDLNKKDEMLNQYECYLELPQSKAVIAACYSFSFEKSTEQQWFTDKTSPSILIYGKTNQNLCIVLPYETFEALTHINIWEYERNKNRIFLFSLEQLENGKWIATIEPTGERKLKEDYKKEFPILFMPEVFKAKEIERLSHINKSIEGLQAKTAGILDIVLRPVSVSLQLEVKTLLLEAMESKYFSGSLSESDQIKLLNDLCQANDYFIKQHNAFKSNNNCLETLHPALYEELMSFILVDDKSEKRQILMLLSLSTLFARISSKSALGTEHDSIAAFRKLSFVCLQKITELNPLFQYYKIANWADRLGDGYVKRNNLSQCSHTISIELEEIARNECRDYSCALFDDIFPSAW